MEENVVAGSLPIDVRKMNLVRRSSDTRSVSFWHGRPVIFAPKYVPINCGTSIRCQVDVVVALGIQSDMHS